MTFPAVTLATPIVGTAVETFAISAGRRPGECDAGSVVDTFLNPAVYAGLAAGGETMACAVARRGFGAQVRSRSMIAPIGVFIVSRNRLFADALASLLAKSDELMVTGVASEPEELAFASDVLLIDADGFAAGARDRSRSPAPNLAMASLLAAGGCAAGCRPIIVGVPCEDDDRLIDLIEAGAQGYVLKGTSPADLVEAIRAVYVGRNGCSAKVAAAVVTRILELERRRVKSDRRDSEPLTAREREVLGWIATGRGNKEIGRRLGISVQTVKNHVHSVLAKLGARRRREALRIAYELGLLGEWCDSAGNE